MSEQPSKWGVRLAADFAVVLPDETTEESLTKSAKLYDAIVAEANRQCREVVEPAEELPACKSCGKHFEPWNPWSDDLSLICPLCGALKLKGDLSIAIAERDKWIEEARRYANNRDYQQKQRQRAETALAVCREVPAHITEEREGQWACSCGARLHRYDLPGLRFPEFVRNWLIDHAKCAPVAKAEPAAAHDLDPPAPEPQRRYYILPEWLTLEGDLFRCRCGATQSVALPLIERPDEPPGFLSKHALCAHLPARPPEPTPEHLFHRLWRKAVGTKGYDKSQWMTLANALDAVWHKRATDTRESA